MKLFNTPINFKINKVDKIIFTLFAITMFFIFGFEYIKNLIIDTYNSNRYVFLVVLISIIAILFNALINKIKDTYFFTSLIYKSKKVFDLLLNLRYLLLVFAVYLIATKGKDKVKYIIHDIKEYGIQIPFTDIWLEVPYESLPENDNITYTQTMQPTQPLQSQYQDAVKDLTNQLETLHREAKRQKEINDSITKILNSLRLTKTLEELNIPERGVWSTAKPSKPITTH